VDRMLGTLVRYLRFLGYDTRSATEIGPGGAEEDNLLLRLAVEEGRILLTRDRELARRGGILVPEDDVLDQVAALARAGLVEPVLRLDRCSRCNTPLRPATRKEADTAPFVAGRDETRFLWCPACRRLYWSGSHVDRLTERLDRVARMVHHSRR